PRTRGDRRGARSRPWPSRQRKSRFRLTGGAWAEPDGERRTRGAQDAKFLCRLARGLRGDAELDLLDLAEGHLQEAGGDLAERGDRAGAEELVGALVVTVAG